MIFKIEFFLTIIILPNNPVAQMVVAPDRELEVMVWKPLSARLFVLGKENL